MRENEKNRRTAIERAHLALQAARKATNPVEAKEWVAETIKFCVNALKWDA